MSASFDRAVVLYHQNRYDLADRELRAALAEQPGHALAHALLALCLAASKKLDEAGREADEAVRLEPGLSFTHYARANVLFERHRLKEAEAAIEEAIQLDPHDADLFSLLAAIRYNRRRWPEALEAAEHGLSLDPEHVDCNNLRAMALIKLGRKQEAGATIEAALAKDPDRSMTHANQGWALLEQNDQAKALEHFREALRLEPNNEWARLGIVEALKSRHLLYRLMLRYFLWMAKLSGQAQWAVLLGLIGGQYLLRRVETDYPALTPVVAPILIIVFLFLMMTWIADPLFNLLLRLSKFGRLVLSREQIIASNWLGASLLAAALCGAGLVASLAWGRPGGRPLLAMVDFLLLTLPIAATFKCPTGLPRLAMGLFALGLFVVGPVMIGLRYLATSQAQLQQMVHLHGNFLTGVILSTWLGVFLQSRWSAR